MNISISINVIPLGLYKGLCTPFLIDGHQVGIVRDDIATEFKKYSDVFVQKQLAGRQVIELNPKFRDYNERTENVEKLLQDFRAKDKFVSLRGWRNEVSLDGRRQLAVFAM